MADNTLPFVRFLDVNADGGPNPNNPGWWHRNAGADHTTCGLQINFARGPQWVEFSDAAKGEFCIRCRPIH